MRFIGIDPGLGGAIAIVYEDGSIASVVKMPDTLQGILDVLVKNAGDEFGGCRGALEYVRSRPGQGAPGMWKFATNYGHCEMALTAARVPYYDVHPLRWQKLLNCRTGGDKNISKARAAELWPGIKITHAIADALLIAEWCRRKTIAAKGTQE